MPSRTFKCPKCSALLTKSDKLYVLAAAREAGSIVAGASMPGPVTCSNCRTVIAAEPIISGALDGAAPAKPTAPPSLFWVIFCPIPVGFGGLLVTHLVMLLPSWLFGFETPIAVPILGGIAFGIAAFVTNLKWYRQGYTPGGLTES
jgi:hypothetical protein